MFGNIVDLDVIILVIIFNEKGMSILINKLKCYKRNLNICY